MRLNLKRTKPLRSKELEALSRYGLWCLRTLLSFWLRETIRRAYQSSDKEADVPRIRAHEVRGIAPTLLFQRNFAVEQVLRAGVWKNQSTFTSFYLRDITHKSLDTFHLGPVVAAQGIV